MRESSRLIQLLKARIQNCRKCGLWKFRKRAIVGEGSIPCDLLFLGQNPGKMENEIGRPFVGRAGKFLDRLLALAHLSRAEVYLTGAVRCPTPKNRMPNTKEIEACKEFLQVQLEVVQPKLIVALGKVALQALGISGNVLQLHGKLLELEGRRVFVTFHPSAAMRFPKIRELSFNDFKKLKSLLENGN